MNDHAGSRPEAADLHFHTTMSDGGATSREAAEACVRQGIRFAVATEHDVVNREFPKIAGELGMRTMEGVEISARAPVGNGKTKHLHLTAYSRKFDPNLDAVLQATRDGRVRKMKLQCEKLARYGFDADHAEFLRRFEGTGFDPANLTNFHLAQYLVEKPSTVSATRDVSGKTVTEPHEFIRTFLKRESPHPVGVPDGFPEYEPAMDGISATVRVKSEGILSIAHPNFTFETEGPEAFENAIAENLVLAGANGVELNPFADRVWTAAVMRVRKRFNLVLTFGSDCHFLPNKTGDGRHSRVGETHPLIRGNVRSAVAAIMDATGTGDAGIP